MSLFGYVCQFLGVVEGMVLLDVFLDVQDVFAPDPLSIDKTDEMARSCVVVGEFVYVCTIRC